MGPDFIREICFTCGSEPADFLKISDSDGDPNPNARHIICQHLCIKEDDLQNAIVCGTCWEKIDQFHQFYFDVKKLHERREVAPLSLFIKQEEITIEDTQLQESCTDVSVGNQKLFDIADCKLEIPEECDEQSEKEEPAEIFPQPKKIRKNVRHTYSRNLSTPDERQMKEDFIKQHTLYFCAECNIEFVNFRAIKNHQIEVHNKDTVVCCGNQHRTRAMLYQHVQSLLNPEAFKCENCGKTFKSKYIYIRHKEMYHATEEDLVFKCNRCPKSFIKKGLLKIHLAEHETLENETAKCEFCGKCFRSKTYLNYHIKAVHKKPTDFICEVCSKGFFKHSMFLEHHKTHELTAEQLKEQCTCQVCGHVSSNMISLKRHAKSRHAPDRKRHVCEQCGKGCSLAVNLKEHVAYAHTGEHLYQCQHCEKKFFFRRTVYSHKKKDHPQEKLEDCVSKNARQEEVSDGDETVS